MFQQKQIINFSSSNNAINFHSELNFFLVQLSLSLSPLLSESWRRSNCFLRPNKLHCSQLNHVFQLKLFLTVTRVDFYCVRILFNYAEWVLYELYDYEGTETLYCLKPFDYSVSCVKYRVVFNLNVCIVYISAVIFLYISCLLYTSRCV